MPIKTALGVDRTVNLNVHGSNQRLRICGARSELPPLLVVQGGPGLPLLHEVPKFQRLLNLEERFLVGYWEQRACGDVPSSEANTVSWLQQIEDLRTAGRRPGTVAGSDLSAGDHRGPRPARRSHGPLRPSGHRASDRGARMKIHAIKTGWVRIKTAQVEGRGRGLTRRLSVFGDRCWTDWLPTYAWAIDHPEGVTIQAHQGENDGPAVEPRCDAVASDRSGEGHRRRVCERTRIALASGIERMSGGTS
jgi:hypothetical protein